MTINYSISLSPQILELNYLLTDIILIFNEVIIRGGVDDDAAALSKGEAYSYIVVSITVEINNLVGYLDSFLDISNLKKIFSACYKWLRKETLMKW